MSEYHNDPSYGKDDYGTTCVVCGKWFPEEGEDYCSMDCELEAEGDPEELANGD